MTEEFLAKCGISDQRVLELLLQEGYDDATFLFGLTQEDLDVIGVASLQCGQSMSARILQGCRQLTKNGIPQKRLRRLDDWLAKLHLEAYWPYFEQLFGFKPTDMEILDPTEEDIVRMGIRKRAHKKKFMEGLRVLRSLIRQGIVPEDKSMEDIVDTQSRAMLANLPGVPLDQSLVQRTSQAEAVQHDVVIDIYPNGESDEAQFWDALIACKIGKDLERPNQNFELKSKLETYRNYAIMVFALVNTFWVILMLSLQTGQSGPLQVVGTNPLGLLFLVLFGGILIIQFLALLCHRFNTLIETLSQIPCPLLRPVKKQPPTVHEV